MQKNTKHCGLDFGTSNSTLGVCQNGKPHLIPFEGNETTFPSAVFFSEESRTIKYGQEAINSYVQGERGRLLRSLKSILGFGLMRESTWIWGVQVHLRNVIAQYLREVKTRAELVIKEQLEDVVLGRPIHFIDGNPKEDALAAGELRSVLYEIGFRRVEYQFEPIAAAISHRQLLSREMLVLVADVGGGTADFSVIKLTPSQNSRAAREEDVLANEGIRIGGDEFDFLLNLRKIMPEFGYGKTLGSGLKTPNWVYHHLARWSHIQKCYTPKMRGFLDSLRRSSGTTIAFDRLCCIIENEYGHRVAADVERTKIALSKVDACNLDLNYIKPSVLLRIQQRDLFEAIVEKLEGLGKCVQDCLKSAGIGAEQIECVLFTGGTTLLPVVQDAIAPGVLKSRILGIDRFGAAGNGLAILAEEYFA